MRDPIIPPPQPPPEDGRRTVELDHKVAQLRLRVTVLEDLVHGLLRLCNLSDSDLSLWRSETAKLDAHAYRLQSSANELVHRLEQRRQERYRRAARRENPPR